MTRTTALAAILIASIALLPGARAQEEQKIHEGETDASVPALHDFHEVIFTIWHTAWPEKNVALLSELAPEVRRHVDILAKAQLPGILRDKEPAWRSTIEELQAVAIDYEKASSPVDSVRLLDAAEQLHARFEALVRVTRPPLKEVEEFHQVLYMIYHHYLPGKDREKLASAVTDLKEKMILLDGAKLPERHKKREPAFVQARQNLSEAVAALDLLLLDADFPAFTAAVETVHTEYQALEHVFE